MHIIYWSFTTLFLLFLVACWTSPPSRREMLLEVLVGVVTLACILFVFAVVPFVLVGLMFFGLFRLMGL